MAVVGYVINLAMGRTLAAKHGYNVDPNQVEQYPSLVQNVYLISSCKHITFMCRKCWLWAAAISWVPFLRSM